MAALDVTSVHKLCMACIKIDSKWSMSGPKATDVKPP